MHTPLQLRLIIPPAQRSCWRYTGFTPSVRPSVRPASRVRSVAPTVLVGSISYLYILSSNFRRCVVCKVSGKITSMGQRGKSQNAGVLVVLVIIYLNWMDTNYFPRKFMGECYKFHNCVHTPLLTFL